MPPIPAVLDERTHEFISNVRRRVEDIKEFQISRLRQCSGPLVLQQQLAAELREDMDGFSRSVESLEDMIEDQKTENKRAELRKVVGELQRSLTSLKMEYRAALLESKRLIDSKKQSQREELLRSSAVSEKPVKDEKVTDDKIMKANEEITDALRRTLNIMQGELEKSVLNSQMLDSSTAMLQSTSTTHDMLTNLMDTSKQLITALEKSDWIDRLLIFFAFTFFLLVVLFIIKQRIIDRGIRIAFWWTRFIPDLSGDAELLQVEEKLLSASVATAATELESQELSTVSVVITSAASMSTGRIVSALSRLKSSAILHDPVITDPASRMPETSVTQSESEPYSLLTASELDIPPSSTPASEAAETPVHIEL